MSSRALAASALVAAVAAAASTFGAQGQRMSLTSSDFSSGQPIPAQFSCEGPGTSPELSWANVPSAAQTLALVVRDPDAASPGFVHWIVYDIPAGTTDIPQAAEATGALPSGAREGTNSKGAMGWTPPCPPSGAHRYQFELFALDSSIPALTAPTEPALISAMRGHILAKADLVGTYQKSR
jgi:Raf kinase inhibitor-like YbhB/YbcL family protein